MPSIKPLCACDLRKSGQGGSDPVPSRTWALAPALLVLALGLDPTRALVLSQVVLSFGIPFALIPLVLLTRRRDVMGALINRPVTTAAAWVVTAVIVSLNAFLLVGLAL